MWQSPGLLNRNATNGLCSTATVFYRRAPKIRRMKGFWEYFLAST